MFSPEAFEEQLFVEGLHTLSWIKRSHIFFGHLIVQRLYTKRGSDYAKQFSPANRARNASLP